MFYLRQSTDDQKISIKLVDSVDGYTVETGITAPTIVLSKSDAAFGAASSGTWAELAYGWYTVNIDETDSATLGKISIHVEKAGCRSFDDYGYVLPANIYDSWFSADKQQVDVTQVEGVDATDQIETAVQTVIETNKLDHLVAVADDDDVVDDSIIAKVAVYNGDWSTFNGLTGSLDIIGTGVQSIYGKVDAEVGAIKDVTDTVVSDMVTAMKADTGFTAGGVLTFAEVVKIIAAAIAGQLQLKSGETDVYEILDADDQTTVIAEVTLSATTPHRSVSVL